ncbi:MAG: RIP metalloprotease RseP [Burkholderiaceae bacterium]|nr:RIP metalloprotease RseP [Burkholderiaceae bacterium]
MTTTIIAFLVAIGILIAVHEWGHYRMAVACGVKVLRFSIGFGKVVARFKPKKQRPGQDTEFVIGLFPLGGYVKMLDGREGEVPEGDRHLAFDTQPLGKRALIVAAGPVANLLLAVLLYAAVNWIGQLEPRAVLAAPVAGSVADKAGLHGGELVRAAALTGQEAQTVRSFESLRWLLIRGALDGQDVLLQLERAGGGTREVTLRLAALPSKDPTPELFDAIGVAPLVRPQIGELTPGGPAERAGLQPGDVVLKVGQTRITGVPQLIGLIRASVADGQPQASLWEIERGGRRLTLEVLPRMDGQHGRIDAGITNAPPDMVRVRYGPVEGLAAGALKVWDVSALSLRLLGRMVTGQLSVRNLSGPVAIADYAGKAAHMGPIAFIGFLAFISVSLGVFNLLPVPVLDGGQLVYFLWEAVTGKPVAGAWLERLQYVGLSLLLAIMTIALYNDIASRWP